MADLTASYGKNTSGQYIRHICYGYRRPSYDLAKAIAAATGNWVTVDQLLSWYVPRTKPRKRKATKKAA